MSKVRKLTAAQVVLFITSFFADARDAVSVPSLPPPEPETKNLVLDTALRQAWERAVTVEYPPPCVPPVEGAVASKKPVIVIDLGHRFETNSGLIDTGTVNRAEHLAEADIVDAVGARLVEILKDKGYDVVLTREPHHAFPIARGDYKTSLSSRGLLPAYLSQELARPVILLSLHVDNMRNGGAVYVQNDYDATAGQDSLDLAQAVAETYRIGASGAHVNPGGDRVDGRGRFDNRMLRTFEAAKANCPSVDGAAALLELGDIRDPNDISAFHRMMHDPDPTAARIAQGLENFIHAHYPEPPQTPPPDRPGQQLTQ